MDSKLLFKVRKGVKAAAGIETLLVLTVAALYLAIVPRHPGSKQLMYNMMLPTKHVQRMDAVTPCRMGKLSSVVRLYLGRCIAKITDRTFHKVYGRIAALFLVGVYEAFP